jgi:hypothetical protein
VEAGRNTDLVMSRQGTSVEPERGENPLKDLERRRKMNMKIETGFRRIRVSNTPVTYRYPRLFPETGSWEAEPYWPG